ncbi:hypothetical protein Pcinc_027555 [Petrolisthes cinctipes]|uniref:Discoidin domain-containing receptor 2-like n=1 Tax=Petrolisthes cinctipes TaxID=88211 RepID=A0AAE1F3V8_PETCI|nr:hypothetical protein Pcinc_027555 [Petrolisthes cinctipes]
MQSGAIPDEHITASSYFDTLVNAHYGRAHVEAGGGAWCPRDRVRDEAKEYLEVNLGAIHVVTRVEVQGRFGNGQGREYAEQYKLQLWRPGLTQWVTYVDGRGTEMLEGNSNTYLAQSAHLSPPALASRVRFLPFSHQPRTVCMRVELYGCRYTGGLVSYSMPDGDLRGGDTALTDLTYDGTGRGSQLRGGLGQLVDGETGHTNFRVDALGMGRGYEWIGWKNTTRPQGYVDLTFQFDGIRNFSAVHIYANNFFTKETQVFSRALVQFSVGGVRYDVLPEIDYNHQPDRIFENARNVTIPLRDMPGRFVRLRLFFALKWLMISEVSFDSVLCQCTMPEEEPLDVSGEGAAGEEAATAVTTEAVLAAAEGLPEGNGRQHENDTSVIPADSTSSSPLLVGLICLALVLGMIPLALGITYYHRRATKKANKKSPQLSESGVSESRKVSMKMKDLHINVNLSPVSNGYAKAKGKLYGHVAMDEETSAMYQEPFKGPMHNPAYYTLGHTVSSSEMPLKSGLPGDTDDSVDYAIPDLNMTPPPPFSEVYTPPPPPVPLTKPPANLPNNRNIREPTLVTPNPTVAPIPALPPPPDQEYYAAPLLCHSSNIQGPTGSVQYVLKEPSNMDTGRLVPELQRSQLRVMDSIGEGLFGLVHLCEMKNVVNNRKVIVKTLNTNTDEDMKEDFKRATQTLSQLDDPNVAKVLGTIQNSEPLCMITEYAEFGDLYQFMRRHTIEGLATCNGSLSRGMVEDTNLPVLSYGALIYMITQVASGMKYLESLSVVHRDLATRNCLVGKNLSIKISDIATSRPVYTSHYYQLGDTHARLPVRWMAWESILQGRFSSKSDVWSFGVTLWEMLTMARSQPYAELSNEGVIENASHCYHGNGLGMIQLTCPPLCPREMFDMITACWRPNDRQRPPFWEILMFLQRKNLGYTLDYGQ